jgi:uncharacterized damage-inducible protein DinB
VSGKLLATQYRYNHFVLHRNTEDLDLADSLTAPGPGGNCVNWVLGHILANRNAALALVGGEPALSEAEAAVYARGGEGLTDLKEALTLDELRKRLDASQKVLQARLEAMTEEDLGAAADDDSTVGETLAGLVFHEAYHAGQIGILRRVTGKAGVLK